MDTSCSLQGVVRQFSLPCMSVLTGVCAHVRIYIYTCMYTYIYIYIYIYNVYIYINMNIYTYIYIYMYMPWASRGLLIFSISTGGPWHVFIPRVMRKLIFGGVRVSLCVHISVSVTASVSMRMGRCLHI